MEGLQRSKQHLRLRCSVGLIALLAWAWPWPAAAAPAKVAQAKEPTVQSLLAARDAELVASLVGWRRQTLAMASDQELEAPLAEAVDQLVQAHLKGLPAVLMAWLAEERAATGNPGLEGGVLSKALFQRSLNEMAIATVESLGQDADRAWLAAVLAPKACSFLPPQHFARQVAMIQAAPLELRPALLAALKEQFARWGTQRRALPERPPAAELASADRALTRLRQSLPVDAAPMSPYLAGQVFARNRKADKPDRWEQCARSQWWLQSQLAAGRTEPARALAIYRYSTMLDVSDFVPEAFKAEAQRPGAGDGKPAYPRAASFFQVQGLTQVAVSLDAEGHATRAEVIARKLSVPGVRGNRPVAFETLLDEAAVTYARQRNYPTGQARETSFEMMWNLDKDNP